MIHISKKHWIVLQLTYCDAYSETLPNDSLCDFLGSFDWSSLKVPLHFSRSPRIEWCSPEMQLCCNLHSIAQRHSTEANSTAQPFSHTPTTDHSWPQLGLLHISWLWALSTLIKDSSQLSSTSSQCSGACNISRMATNWENGFSASGVTSQAKSAGYIWL